MLFIEGIGYVDDAVPATGRTQAANETTDSFDAVLQTETDKLNQTGQTVSLDAIFREASEKYGVSEKLLKAIAYTESGFQADATSPSGAMGIMQLMPETASAYGVTDPYDAYQNIMGGAAVLKKLLQMFQGNQPLAIAAYNAGCGNVQKYGGIPPFSETQSYVQKVTALAQSGVTVPGAVYPVSSVEGNETRTGQTKAEDSSSEQTARKNAELLAEIREIISAISMLSSDNSTYTDTLRQSGLSALTGNSGGPGSSTDYSSLLSSYSNPVSSLLSSLDTVDITDTGDLQSLLSYAEYQLFSMHYQNMLDIISVLGSTSITGETDTDDSLSDLFRLAARQSQSRVASIDFSGVTL